MTLTCFNDADGDNGAFRTGPVVGLRSGPCHPHRPNLSLRLLRPADLGNTGFRAFLLHDEQLYKPHSGALTRTPRQA